MSLSGNLEHLPIVDVIQLLHTTQKTGTLCLASTKGESQLVFHGGYIVSANHVRNNVRIGQILVEMGAITPEQREHALSRQSSAGSARKPLIATLIEAGQLRKEDASRGLETLIEMTIVEILTWNSGTFSLDVHSTITCDEYRYFPETLKQDLSLNTQGLLMDALRIYDEKTRDGSLKQGAFTSETVAVTRSTGTIITADDLGLEDLDSLDKKIPDVFLGLKEYDSAEIHRSVLRENLADLPQSGLDRLLALLMEFSEVSSFAPPQTRPGISLPAVILFSRDEFLKHCIMTICKHEHIFAFATDDENSLDLIVEQSYSKELVPILIIDAPAEIADGFSTEDVIALLQQKLDKFPDIAMLQLVATRDNDFSLRAMQSGVRNILTRPGGDKHDPAFIAGVTTFLGVFHDYLQKNLTNPEQLLLKRFRDCIVELGSQRKVPDVAFTILKFASTMFERTLTFVVGNNQLIAEKGFGITMDKGSGATPPLLFSVPLLQQSVFQDVVQSGRNFYGQSSDAMLRNHLYAEIGAPHSPKILLMPIKTFGKTIAIIYGDFGDKSGLPLKMDLLDIVTRHAELVLDNNLYRKKLASSGAEK